MEIVIKDRERIIANGLTDWHVEARGVLLDLFLCGLESVDPEKAVKRAVRLSNDTIKVRNGGQEHVFKLYGDSKIYIIGAGKATAFMARAIEDVFGSRLESGIINIPGDQYSDARFNFKRVKVYHA
ncbi:MAG: DUF4147 domain-containing protein, partial [Promethearchaeota archaeon]